MVKMHVARAARDRARWETDHKTYYDTAIIYATNNGRSGTGSLGQRHAARVQGRVAVVVGKGEARHGGWVWWASVKLRLEAISGCKVIYRHSFFCLSQNE